MTVGQPACSAWNIATSLVAAGSGDHRAASVLFDAYAGQRRYLVSAIRVVPMQLLNGMLFFITVLLLAIDFYHRWTDGDSVTLLGRPYFCRICFLPVVPPALV